MKGLTFIYSNPVMEPLASRFGTVHTIKRELFPGGMPNIIIDDMEQIQNAHNGANIIYFSQYASLEEKKIEEMIIFVFADTYNVRSFTVVDLYDPMATMERVTVEGTVASSNVDAHFWKTLPRLDSGRKITRVLYDHHTLQNRFYFTGGSTSVVFKSAMTILLDMLEGTTICTVAFPDDGAYKRFGPYFKQYGYDTVICGKERIGDKRVVTIKEGNPKVAEIIIVDDLIRSGGTILECAKKLKEMGATSVSTFVTHAEFPNESWKKFVDQDTIDTFYTTNSIPRVADIIKDTEPFVVLDLYSDLQELFVQRGLI